MKQLEDYVPGPDFCVCLKQLGYPQNETLLCWISAPEAHPDTGERTFRLKYRKTLFQAESHYAFAAPLAEEFNKLSPARYFPMPMPEGFAIIDARQTQMRSVKFDNGPLREAHALTFVKIKETSAKTLSEAWAKAFIYLMTTKQIRFMEGKAIDE